MRKTEFKGLSKEQLEKKKDSLKIYMWVFIPLIIALLFFGILDYFSGEGIGWLPTIVIAICTIGGFIPVYQELKQVQQELRSRN